jgi:ribosomal protein S18 acetylase RimI-like enzyme
LAGRVFEAVNIRPLQAEDEPIIRAWLKVFLIQHLHWWGEGYGHESVSDLSLLVERDWQELKQASQSHKHLVGVLEMPGKEVPGKEVPGKEVPGKDGAGQAVGIVRVGLREDRSLGFQIGVLQWIYVDPAQRGRGLGGHGLRAHGLGGHGLADQLMVHALSWMDAQQVSGREVFVTALNPAAVALYRRHGFEVADYRMLARGPGGPTA